MSVLVKGREKRARYERMMLHPRPTMHACAALLLLGCMAFAQGGRQQNAQPPLPEKTLPSKDEPLPVPLDLDSLLTPETPPEPPRQRLQKATDAMQPVLPPLDAS